MNKIIAISLWGDNPRYSIGAIRNAELAEKYFPDWKLKIYYGRGVNTDHLETLKTFSSVNLVECSNDWAPCFWRFMDVFESEDNIVLLRDSDSRLSLREKVCVDKWLTCDAKYLIIRDHIRHYDFPMLAGMWGYKGKMSGQTFNKMRQYYTQDFYTIDQIFLREVVWKDAWNNRLTFGLVEDKEFYESREKILPHFIGQGYDENETPIYPIE